MDDLRYWIVLNNMAVVCLPSLRPIYRLVVKGSLKSTQHSNQGTHQSGTWNGKSRLQALSVFKNTYSESTNQLAVTDSNGNKSFTDGFGAASSRGSDATCEADNIALGSMPQGREGILVKDEVVVKISASNRAEKI